ncbi:MAG: metallopeptidase family protein [Candidatus Humimicrobiaceae bacterium]
MEKEEFRKLIIEAAEELPVKFQKKLENISIVIDDENIKKSKKDGKKIILGLYQGLPITKRAGKRNIYPDKITIYQKAIESICSSETQIRERLRKVLLHEIGHFFGLDDGKLKGLGY